MWLICSFGFLVSYMPLARLGRGNFAARISRAYSSRLIDLKHTRCLFLAVIAFASAKRWLKAAGGRFLPLLCLASAT